MFESRHPYDDAHQPTADDGSAYESHYPPYDPHGHQLHDPQSDAPAHQDLRTSRRPVAVAIACLVALILIPVAVDRVACARTEARTARAFQEGMDTALPPQVRVHGFPVLTQLASGTLRDVDLTAHHIPSDGGTRQLPVTDLSLHMEGLRASDDESEATAREAEATAFLSYADVSNALGVEISQGGSPRRISVIVPLPFGDQATATTTVSALSGNRIAFGDFQVAGGPLPAVANALLDKAFERPIPLQNIPDGLRLRSVTTTANGLSARFSGKSVTFRPDYAS